MNLKVEQSKKNLVVRLPQKFSLSQTLDSGQCFRWNSLSVSPSPSASLPAPPEGEPKKASPFGGGVPKGRRGVAEGDGEGFTYSGIVGDKKLVVSQTDETTLVFHDTTAKDFDEFWKAYFDLERDYDALKKIFTLDATLQKAIRFCGGIRVLNQPKWETLCSYIVSQNNNIPRIKSIIERICATFGSPIEGGFSFTFPTPENLARASVADFEKLGLGYRAPYIAGAARAVANGTLCLNAVATLPIDEARKELRKLLGVGPKVAECALLYGFGKAEAFPIDTWIKKTMAEFYPNGLPEFVKPQAGIAQIFLFHYVRNFSAPK